MTPDVHNHRRPLGAVISILGAAAVVGLGLTILERRSDPVYAIETYHLVLASTAAILALISLAGTLVIRRYDLAALGGLVTVLLVSGIAALSSIGILLILLALIPLALLIKRMAATTEWPAVLTGAGVGAGLVLLTWVAIQPPLVACGQSGATVHIDERYGSVSGEATSHDEGEVGRVDFDGKSLSYECRHGDLVRFELTQKPG